MPYILALDVSMGHSYSVLYKDDTCLFEDEIEHTQRGFHALLEEIQHLPERPLIVFEATGIYSRPVEKFFQDHHFSYCLLNPLEAKKQMEENTLRSWKTDKSDAHRLAQTHLKNQRQPKEVQSNFYLEMRDLARFYQEIEKKITRLRMDLHNCLQLTFPELEQFFSNRLTPYALTLIRLFPHPDFVLASTRTKIKNKLINETRKKSPRIVPSKRQIKSSTMHSVPIQLLKRQYPLSKTIYYAELLQDLLEQKEALATQMIKKPKALLAFCCTKHSPGLAHSQPLYCSVN